jgi:hypothetical protein
MDEENAGVLPLGVDQLAKPINGPQGSVLAAALAGLTVTGPLCYKRLNAHEVLLSVGPGHAPPLRPAAGKD